MRLSTRLSIAAPLLILTVGALAGTGCSDAPPTAATVHSVPALRSQVPSAHGNAIRQRVADKRAQSLTPDEVARVKSLRGKWQWAADMHHAVMQEAIHDPSIGGLRRPRTNAERCEITLRYLKKHYPDIEARVGTHKSAAERIVAIHALVAQVGACPAAQTQASIFGVSMPRRANTAHVARTSASMIRTASGAVNTEDIATAWRDYVVPMTADIRTAKDLSDAIDIMDSYLATASADPGVPLTSLALIAGTIDLATSSANEWDTFARPHEGSMFMWGWLSDLGGWVGNVVGADAGGCIAGMDDGIGGIGAWGSFGDFLSASAGFCFGGALVGSLWGAL
jgi:hypothetical protein